jgi:hypothetical protein
MKIDDAIERLGSISLPIKTKDDHANHEAVWLGIEALKRVKEDRYYEVASQKPLPGETSD